MMDALVPAVNALRLATPPAKHTGCREEAASAARSEAESTKDLVARYGPSKFLGERTRAIPTQAPHRSLFFLAVSAPPSRPKRKS